MRTTHRIKQRILIEELNRKRRSDDADRFVEIYRRSTIDPNAHQIEAAMFALRRLSEGGAMLCDEVGLGKTIETGLVISQLKAEGRSNILIVVPLALARQWQVELQDLFSLNATIIGASSTAIPQKGIVLVGREFASTPKGKALLEQRTPYDLIIVDEAHEMFASIHTRFSKANGSYQENLSKGSARRAAQVKALMRGSPVLLLTATPLQNNLYELWGLVHYVDPQQHVLGRFNEFCTLFVTGEGGRALMPNMDDTLRRRLSLVVKRTLRRQAQPFMKQPFRKRNVHTANFHPERIEAELYDAINSWLSKEVLAAYRKGHRNLMALQLRRRMASSTEALVATLSGIRDRMSRMLETGRYAANDDDEFELENLNDDDTVEPLNLDAIKEDLADVERLESLARKVLSQATSAKKERLLDVIRKIESHAVSGVASDKVVIFTESVRTLESIRQYLEANGYQDLVTTFAGTNDGPVAKRALEKWEHDVGQFQEQGQLEPAAAVRGALIHEFKTRTRILIATEAGAKGLNLQFCNCLINYDLPWNPQRIEQRIGRVHRYGQLHDVVIFNFINLSNESEQRVYELLEQKLNVFQAALDSSDTILNTPEVALNLEATINDMLNRCRSQSEIREAFDRLKLDLDVAQRQLKDERISKMRQLLGDFDSSVSERLVLIEGKISPSLSRCDEILLEILKNEGGDELEVLEPRENRSLLRWKGKLFHLGPPAPGSEFGEPLHREHPELRAIINECISQTDGQTIVDDSSEHSDYDVYRVLLRGLEEEERLLVVGTSPPATIAATSIDLESGLLNIKSAAQREQKDHIDRLLNQIAARRQDLLKCGQARMKALEAKLEEANKARRYATSTAAGTKAQTLQKRILNEIETAKKEIEEEISAMTVELDIRERQTRLKQFVEAEPKLLFSVKQVSTAGRKET